MHLGIDLEGVRRVNEIVAVPGRVENDIIETETVFERAGGELVATRRHAAAAGAFERLGIDVHGLLAGAR